MQDSTISPAGWQIPTALDPQGRTCKGSGLPAPVQEGRIDSCDHRPLGPSQTGLQGSMSLSVLSGSCHSLPALFILTKYFTHTPDVTSEAWQREESHSHRCQYCPHLMELPLGGRTAFTCQNTPTQLSPSGRQLWERLTCPFASQ